MQLCQVLAACTRVCAFARTRLLQPSTRGAAPLQNYSAHAGAQHALQPICSRLRSALRPCMLPTISSPAAAHHRCLRVSAVHAARGPTNPASQPAILYDARRNSSLFGSHNSARTLIAMRQCINRLCRLTDGLQPVRAGQQRQSCLRKTAAARALHRPLPAYAVQLQACGKLCGQQALPAECGSACREYFAL